jgi:5'-nucleotidase
MYNRRKFITQSAFAAGAMLTSNGLFAELEKDAASKRLTILHTNDVHSRLEPFPMDGGRNQGLGGVAARAELIRSIREKEKNVLLLDAGDIFQGTPYFNIYKGEPEMKAMATMGYDAATMGNHDFDSGLENFATQLMHGKFPLLISNYDFTDTPMEGKFEPYKIFKRGRVRIGITAVGIELKGLVPDSLFGNTKYLDPVAKANEMAEKLKKEENCDLVICLSHLGYQFKDNPNKVCDEILARESSNIDLILGGHTHTFLDAPVVFKNKNGMDIIVNQVGWAGIILGRLDFEFEGTKKNSLIKSHTVIVREKTNE